MEHSNLTQEYRNRFTAKINSLAAQIGTVYGYKIRGRIISALGVVLNAYLPDAKIGDLCMIYLEGSQFELYAEVVAIDGQYAKLLPFGSIASISHNCRVYLTNESFKISVGSFLLGKIVDGFGHVNGGLGTEVKALDSVPNSSDAIEELSIMAQAPSALERPLISNRLDTGITAIDLFTTCGVGQRIAIFAGPGMGKTTLMGMILRNAQVDVLVVALIGERGREVREFIDLELNEDLRKRCVLVVSTSDRPPVEQVKCAYVAQTIAEYFRGQGKNVVLFVDSITRFARAQREIGLSAGEPLARGGFPPSVFLSFPRLMERAGNTPEGSVTAFYTVLMVGDDFSKDPVADEVKSIVDGHIVLSRKLAEKGHFPAIDLQMSLSRIADRIIDKEHLKAARHIRLLLAKYQELEFLIRVGEYQAGQDSLADEAINKSQPIAELVQQGQFDRLKFKDMLSKLITLAKK